MFSPFSPPGLSELPARANFKVSDLVIPRGAVPTVHWLPSGIMYGDPQQHARDVILTPGIFAQLALQSLDRTFARGSKIGDNLKVRMPYLRLPPNFNKPPVSISDDISLNELAKLLGR